MNVIFCVVFFVGLLGNIGAEQAKESVQTIDHPHKNEYSSVVAGSDKHKYGYELKENRHFHHTTTEEDGVRLGCYGYVLYGKKYSTQYVADVKGYRPVYTHDAITVYPKSGGERKASFVGDFDEAEQRSGNIRYFFPDGCKGIDIKMLPVEFPPPQERIIKKPDEPVNPPKVPVQPTKPLFRSQPPTEVEPPFDPSETSTTLRPAVVTPPKAVVTAATTPKPVPVTTTPKPTQKTTKPVPSTPKPSPPTPKPIIVTTPPLLTRIAVPSDSVFRQVSPPVANECQKSCCGDDDSVAKIVLPVPMRSLGKSSGSCERFAKLIIPIEGLNPDSLRSLTKGADASELIKTVLQSLS